MLQRTRLTSPSLALLCRLRNRTEWFWMFFFCYCNNQYRPINSSTIFFCVKYFASNMTAPNSVHAWLYLLIRPYLNYALFHCSGQLCQKLDRKLMQNALYFLLLNFFHWNNMREVYCGCLIIYGHRQFIHHIHTQTYYYSCPCDKWTLIWEIVSAHK